ncbi:MAG TPA: hypothetical protein VG797_07460, partial [Phycisphaerales bacterium]|nr:hypothetical protein [Phycisphaerales bacterium]
DPVLHDGIVAEISGQFLIQPFDVSCVSEAARLFQIGKPMRGIGKTSQPHTRARLKADTLIIASAKASGASIFFTGDAQCLELASTCMTAKDLPDVAPGLFMQDLVASTNAPERPASQSRSSSSRKALPPSPSRPSDRPGAPKRRRRDS